MKQQSPCDDKSLLITYLYGECDPDERRAVEGHLAGCASCAAELDELRGVRVALREWAPPEQALGFRVVREEAPVLRPARWWTRGLRAPAWAQAAAAVLLVAVGAGVGTLGIRRDTPSSADLARLERQLQQQAQQISELRTIATVRRSAVASPVAPAATSAPAPSRAFLSQEDQAKLLHQVQLVVDSLGQRQKQAIDQQIAERFLRLSHDVDTQRIADQRRFMLGLNAIDQRTSQIGQNQNALVRMVTQIK